MAERNEVKPRKCDKCEQVVETTAKGIKEHEASCEGVVAQ